MIVDKIINFISSIFRWDTSVGKFFITLLMIGISWLISYEIHSLGGVFGIVIIVLVLGIALTLFSLNKIEFGFYAVLTYGFFANFAKKLIFGLGISQSNIPLGIGVNLLLAAVFFGLIRKELLHKKTDWSGFWTPITIALLADIAYTILVAFNPSGAGFSSWLTLGFRWISFDFMLIIVAYSVFSSLRKIIYFTKFWLALILMTGCYTLYQEHIGLPIWDYKYLHSSAEIYKLNFIEGRFRLSGMLGDVSESGLLMAYSSVVLVVFILYSRVLSQKIQLGLVLIVTLLAMSYSGTRTAYAILPLGLALMAMLTIKQRTTMIASVFGLLTLLFILFAPIHNPSIKRIRSTFSPEDDPSYQLREEKWGRIQPWIRARPIGSGLGSSGPLNPEKEEADSGYVSQAIERGWVGLLIKLGLYFTILSYGISCFYRSNKYIFKALYLAYTCAFFTMTVAHLPQDALDKWPSYIIMQASFIAIIRLKQFENKKITRYG